MNRRISFDDNQLNYRSLVLAGLGSVGQGVLALAELDFKSFEKIALVDNDPICCQKILDAGSWPLVHGDIEDTTFVDEFLSSLPQPVLFVNLCDDIDTVKLRTFLALHQVGYIDVCESRTEDNPKSRFSLGMSYTNQPCHGEWPHLICQGINPGMVEYMTRMVIDEMDSGQSDYSVTIYENDQLVAAESDKTALVSWSPRDLVDEVMTAPAMRFENQQCVEAARPGGQLVAIQWAGQIFDAWQAGHEDIWNLGQLSLVSDTQFFYTLGPAVMDILKTQPRRASEILRLPDGKEQICGNERIIVSVKQNTTGFQRNILWQTDHSLMQRTYGINAVQFQTAASVLLAMLLIQHTDMGCWEGTFNASTLPLALDRGGRTVFRQLMDRLGIRWQLVGEDYVCVLQAKTDEMAQNTDR